MKISSIAAALLVATTTSGCSSCAKDDAPRPSDGVPSDTPSAALTERKAGTLPRGFERRPPGNLTPVTAPETPAAAAVVDAGPADATTH